MSSLLEATVEFEKILPNQLYYTIHTASNQEYGNLHKIYYDIANISEEDEELIKVLKPFIEVTSINVAHYDTKVVMLREYLLSKGYKVKGFEYNKLDLFYGTVRNVISWGKNGINTLLKG